MVIDFGVAKAISQPLTEKTLFTAYGQMLGTPLCMSPEQAEMRGDVDTRIDVYSLGVLLYELLTGSNPFDKQTLKEAGFDEMRRMIREDEPPKPSARLSTLNAETLSTLSSHRGSDPRKLSRQLHGELDWTVMKALEKDRARRYESASAFAADIERFLGDEPVQACPPSVWYRLRKFSRRNQARLTTALIVLVSVFSAVGYFAVDRAAQRQEREARRSDLIQQINEALTEAERYRERARVAQADDLTAWTKAREFARRAQTLAESGLINPSLKERVRALLGELESEERDRILVAALENARMAGMTVDLTKLRFRGLLAVPKFEQAFRDYGIDPQKMTAEHAAQRIRSRPSAVRLALVDGLDHWIRLAPHYEGNSPQKKSSFGGCAPSSSRPTQIHGGSRCARPLCENATSSIWPHRSRSLNKIR